jgi:hypothetical protein
MKSWITRPTANHSRVIPSSRYIGMAAKHLLMEADNAERRFVFVLATALGDAGVLIARFS